MQVPNDELDEWVRLTAQMQQCFSIACTNRGTNQRDALLTGNTLAAQLTTRLIRAGAQGREPIDLMAGVSLNKLDTPANRRYLRLLEETYEAALAVDRERYGEDIGTDGMAQGIEMILSDVRQEVDGAQGTLTE